MRFISSASLGFWAASFNLAAAFAGPGIYEIVPLIATDKNVNSWGGSGNPDESIRLYPRGSSASDNALWQFSLVTGFGVDAEYTITNNRNGYYLTASGKNAPTFTRKTPASDPNAHWKVIRINQGGRYLYFIKNAAGKGLLNLRGLQTSTGTDILAWDDNDMGENTKFYLDDRF